MTTANDWDRLRPEAMQSAAVGAENICIYDDELGVWVNGRLVCPVCKRDIRAADRMPTNFDINPMARRRLRS